jgi:hypothetical protein
LSKPLVFKGVVGLASGILPHRCAAGIKIALIQAKSWTSDMFIRKFAIFYECSCPSSSLKWHSGLQKLPQEAQRMFVITFAL